MDEHTARRNKLMYAMLMIEVKLNQNFPRVISFVNEFGDDVIQDVHYEWIPIVCKGCSGIGHEIKDCRNVKKVTQVWKPKEKKEVKIDEDGFQAVNERERCDKRDCSSGG